MEHAFRVEGLGLSGLQLAKAMRVFKCWVQESETVNDKQTRSLTYTQEGTASNQAVDDVGPADEGNGGGDNKRPKPDTSITVKQKTTKQMAKSVPNLHLIIIITIHSNSNATTTSESLRPLFWRTPTCLRSKGTARAWRRIRCILVIP